MNKNNIFYKSETHNNKEEIKQSIPPYLKP